MALEQGILKAIEDCRADGTMAGFLKQHHGEVFGMVSLQWDEEKARAFYESEARAEGKAEGRAEGENGVMEAIRMLKDNLPIDTIIEQTGMTSQRLTELKAML